VLGALWGKDYLMQVNGFSAESASAINSMLFVGTIVGSFAVGIIADSFNQRKSVMIIGALLSFVVMLLIRFWSHADVNTMWILFLILGFTTSTQVLPYPIITKSNPLAVTGAALGMASVLIMAGGAVFQPIMGALLDLHHGAASIPTVYHVADYQFAFTIFPLMVLFGLICAFLIRDIRITQETM
jgi:MFS family permease